MMRYPVCYSTRRDAEMALDLLNAEDGKLTARKIVPFSSYDHKGFIIKDKDEPVLLGELRASLLPSERRHVH